MKAQRGKQEAGPSRREEWKLLYFIFKKKKEEKKEVTFQQPSSQWPNSAIYTIQDLSTCKTKRKHMSKSQRKENKQVFF